MFQMLRNFRIVIRVFFPGLLIWIADTAYLPWDHMRVGLIVWGLVEVFLFISPRYGQWRKAQWTMLAAMVWLAVCMAANLYFGAGKWFGAVTFILLPLMYYGLRPVIKKWQSKRRLEKAVERDIPEPILLAGARAITPTDLASITSDTAGILRIPFLNTQPTMEAMTAAEQVRRKKIKDATPKGKK